MAYQRIKHYRQMAYLIECHSTGRDAYLMTAEKHTDILPKLHTKIAEGKCTKDAQKQSSEWLWPISGPLRPYRTSHEEIVGSAYRMYKAALREQKRTTIAVSMTTYCGAYALDIDQRHTAQAWSEWHNLPPSNGYQRVIYENWWLWRCQEPKLTSWPEVTIGLCFNFVKIEHSATSDTTVIPQVEQVMKEPSRCNDVQIESIGTSHTTVSQEAEDFNYHPESWLHCYWATMAINNWYDEVVDGVTNFQHEADSHSTSVKSYWQVNSPPGGSLLRLAWRWLPRSPTKMSRVCWEASLRSRPRLYRIYLSRATMESTGWSPKWTSNDDYPVKQHLWVNVNYQ